MSRLGAATVGGATSLGAIGAAIRAAANCGPRRPEIRRLVRASRLNKAA